MFAHRQDLWLFSVQRRAVRYPDQARDGGKSLGLGSSYAVEGLSHDPLRRWSLAGYGGSLERGVIRDPLVYAAMKASIDRGNILIRA